MRTVTVLTMLGPVVWATTASSHQGRVASSSYDSLGLFANPDLHSPLFAQSWQSAFRAANEAFRMFQDKENFINIKKKKNRFPPSVSPTNIEKKSKNNFIAYKAVPEFSIEVESVDYGEKIPNDSQSRSLISPSPFFPITNETTISSTLTTISTSTITCISIVTTTYT